MQNRRAKVRPAGGIQERVAGGVAQFRLAPQLSGGLQSGMQGHHRFTEVTQPLIRRQFCQLGASVLLGLVAACQAVERPPVPRRLSARSDRGGIELLNGADLFASVRVGNRERMSVNRLRSLNGVDVLRGFPLQPRVGESVDHPEQTGLWFGHRTMNGSDLWFGDGGGVVREHTLKIDSETSASMVAQIDWTNSAGARVCQEQRRLKFELDGSLLLLDIDMSITAPPEGLVFGDVREGFLAARLADHFQARAGGTVIGPTRPGGAAPETVPAGAPSADRWSDRWADFQGERARWIASVSSVASGERATVCFLEDPRNPGHPNRWQVRPYGLISANPFARGAFTDDPRDDVPVIVDSYGGLRLRYRIVVSPGALTPAEVSTLWEDYARP